MTSDIDLFVFGRRSGEECARVLKTIFSHLAKVTSNRVRLVVKDYTVRKEKEKEREGDGERGERGRVRRREREGGKRRDKKREREERETEGG
jgi:hypothetical protein